MKALLIVTMFLLAACVPQNKSGSQERNANGAVDATDATPEVSLAERLGLGEDEVEFSCEKNRETDGMHLEFSLHYEMVHNELTDEIYPEIITTCAAYYGSQYLGASHTRREGQPGYGECQVYDGVRTWAFSVGENGVSTTNGTDTEVFQEGTCE